MDELGAALRAARSAAGLSQPAIANALRVDPAFISAIECGRRPFPVDRIADLPDPVRRAVAEAAIERYEAILSELRLLARMSP